MFLYQQFNVQSNAAVTTNKTIQWKGSQQWNIKIYAQLYTRRRLHIHLAPVSASASSQGEKGGHLTIQMFSHTINCTKWKAVVIRDQIMIFCSPTAQAENYKHNALSNKNKMHISGGFWAWLSRRAFDLWRKICYWTILS